MESYIFKKTLFTIIVILILSGCKDKLDTNHLSKGIDSVLSDYIDRYPKDSVIIMQFYRIEDRTILNIQHSSNYPFREFVDGCFIYKDRLAIYSILDKTISVDSLIDMTAASDKTILDNFKSWDEVDFEYDDYPDSETYLVKTRDCITKSEEKDLKYKEIVSDTIGIRNVMINSMLNKRLNKYHVPIIAIRFASLDKSNYFMVSEVNAYTRKSLNGCLKRNDRIIVFYGTDNLHSQDILDLRLIQKELPLLNNYKELPTNWFNYESSEGDVFKILPNGEIEKVSVEDLSDQKYEMLYNAFGL